jgi:hypothetical protein
MDFNSRLDIPHATVRRAGVSGRTKRESAQICRERSANDLLASASMLNDNQRTRMETSAAMWAERAETLQRIEDLLEERTAKTAAARSIAEGGIRGQPTRL